MKTVNKMRNRTPCLIGLAGPTAAGKSTLARALARRHGNRALLFPIDAFYRDLAHIEPAARACQNFDEPNAIEWTLLHRVLDVLRRGEAAEAPVYDYAAHTRSGDVIRLEPAAIILLEGLHVLHQPRLRALLDAAIYLDCPREVCLERRLRRDTAERGRSKAEVIEQFEQHAWPMAERFVLPSRAYAGLVLDGTQATEDVEAAAVAWLAGGAAFDAGFRG